MTNTSPGRRSLRAEQKLLTRRRLLDAATEVFHERGFVAATVDDIVNAAEVSRATFYLHYANKEAILEEISANFLPEYVAKFEHFGEHPRTESSEMRQWMTGMVGFLRAHRGRLAAITEAALAGEAFVAQQRAEAVDAILALMPNYVATSGPDDDLRVRLELLLSQLFSLMAFEWPQSDEQLADVLAEQWAVLDADRPIADLTL